MACHEMQDVRKLIQTVDDSEDGEVNFAEFLAMMHGQKQTKERTQYRLSDPKRQPEVALRPQTERGHRPTPTTCDNSVLTLFNDLQAGKLGDLTLPFPILITAYRRRMLLNAHMAPDVLERSKGQSVLSALETTRRDALAAESARDTKVRETPMRSLVDRAGVLHRQDVEARRSSLRRASTDLDDEIVQEIAKPKPKLGLFLPDLFN
ncbi:hypothetical protein SDRG_17060 [Saprolegnia diclina VS20]|uniref:EF-hand domain-containing protein n=1 Tax=Saprolegnia diclina (strain VS20) TaxID=1156394 RepID=T0PI65_SAPDV|nr:hypothetical protein SDRG_17060 [Saprolegnia diclina VS20]EQC25054.1 hypothetical protein SDRG_17060 [Saprolegnia diclina VS20]|eukprot:XP_008621517.1 hypothetical protein SDRG_17060 [Saprolegnia diclina VS20]